MLQLSQAALGHAMHVSAQSVRAWEQGVKRPSGTAARLLDLFEMHPHLVGGTDAPRASLPSPASDADQPHEHDAPSGPLAEWWREATIARLVTALYRHVRQYVNPYSLLVAPRTIDGVSEADARTGYPDVYVIDPEATIASRRTAITALRLAIDVLPLNAAVTPSVTDAIRLRTIPTEEHWLVDPFARRVTVRRVADSTTRHHRREIVWHIMPHTRPLQVPVRPLFLPDRRWPSVNPGPSPTPVETTATARG